MTAAATSPRSGTALESVEVLADPLRREIVRHLADQDLCTCHLTEITGASQPTVSYHLRVLRDAGWIRPEPAGRYTYYVLQAPPITALADTLHELATRSQATRRRPACD